MAWLDLERDIADLFDVGALADAREDFAGLARRSRPPPLEDPPPHTKTGRVFGAVVRGARTPKQIALVTGLHRMDVVSYLKALRRDGRIVHTSEGWDLA